MINNEYKNSSEVYKVQTFRTTQITDFDAESQKLGRMILMAGSKRMPFCT